MTTILAHIRVKPGMEDRVEAMARALFVASHANEPGLLRYEYWRGHDPLSYYAFISCQDYAAFITHQASEHHVEFTKDFGEMIESFRLEFVDPVGGASPLPPTVHGPPPSDPTPGITHYVERYPETVQPWWLERR